MDSTKKQTNKAKKTPQRADLQIVKLEKKGQFISQFWKSTDILSVGCFFFK